MSSTGASATARRARGMMTQHNYGTAGVYTVSLVVTDTVCGTSDSTSFQVTSTISVGENGLNQVVRAFPNPSNGQVVVSISGSGSLRRFDSSGERRRPDPRERAGGQAGWRGGDPDGSAQLAQGCLHHPLER